VSSSHVFPKADELFVVALGGVVGALARAGIGMAIPHTDPGSWPWATFVTNLLGCLVLGVVLAYADGRHEHWLTTAPHRARLIRPLLATGVLGGFTTFSTFSVEVVRLIRSDDAPLAALYAVGSVVLGVALFALARSVAAGWFGRMDVDLSADEEL
jgi:CrcB protein